MDGQPLILVLDGNEERRERRAEAVSARGYDVIGAASQAEAFDYIFRGAGKIKCAVMDDDIDGRSGYLSALKVSCMKAPYKLPAIVYLRGEHVHDITIAQLMAHAVENSLNVEVVEGEHTNKNILDAVNKTFGIHATADEQEVGCLD